MKAPGRKAMDLNKAVQTVVSRVANDHAAVIFNGDGYSDEWHAEAAERGLKNLKTTPDALPEIIAKPVVAMFKKHKVLSKRELESRFEIYTEQYILSVMVEANTVVEMAKTAIYPAAMRYASDLAAGVAGLQAIGVEADTSVAEQVSGLASQLTSDIVALEEALEAAHGKKPINEAKYLCDVVLPRCWKFVRLLTPSKALLPTTCGHCRPTKKCCSSNSICSCPQCADMPPSCGAAFFWPQAVMDRCPPLI